MATIVRRIGSIRRKKSPPDYLLGVSLAVILIFGLLLLSSASSDLGKRIYGDTYYFVKLQLLKGIIFGGALFFVFYFFPFRYLKKWSAFLLVLNIILLILVFSPIGQAEKGAARWLNLGFLSFQPSELVKFTFIIYLASWLSGKSASRRTSNLKEGFLPFLLFSGLISFLLLLQPATSIVVIIMAAALIIYFSSGAKLSYLAGIILLGFICLSVFIAVTPYRLERIKTYFAGESADKQGSAFHINQALITIGSGGIFGVGYGRSLNKIKNLPEPINDSIFAIAAEEFGFVGSCALIFIFYLFVLRSFMLAKKCNDEFSKLVIIGFASIIGVQAFLHISSISGLLPLTGASLPFVSYGGTAMAILLSMAGVMMNMSKNIS